jgi:hypothetical protein
VSFEDTSCCEGLNSLCYLSREGATVAKMQKILSPRNVLQLTKLMRPTTVVQRAFSSKDHLTIKTNLEQLSGIRWQELQAEAEGKVTGLIMLLFTNIILILRN